VIDRNGELVTTLGREGDGPGEFRMSGGIFLLDDGAVGVIKPFPGKVIVLNADGTPGGTIKFEGRAEDGGFKVVAKVRRCGDRLVGVHGRAVMDMEKVELAMTNILAITDLEGETKTEICKHTTTMDFTRPGFDEGAMYSEQSVWTAGAGRIYTAPERGAYTIRVRDLDGVILTEYSRPFSTRRRSAEEMKDRAQVTENARDRGLDIADRSLETDPAISELHVSADGKLFVRSCWDRRDLLPQGTAARYDVISQKGKFLEQVSYLISGFDPDNDLVLFLDGTNFLLIRNADQAGKAMFAGLMGSRAGDEREDLGDAEPLEVVFYRTP
jgi:hypothetical protein